MVGTDAGNVSHPTSASIRDFEVIRACTSTVPASKSVKLLVDFATDPYW